MLPEAASWIPLPTRAGTGVPLVLLIFAVFANAPSPPASSRCHSPTVSFSSTRMLFCEGFSSTHAGEDVARACSCAARSSETARFADAATPRSLLAP